MTPVLSVVTANLDSPIVGDVVDAVLAQADALRAAVEVLVAGRDGPGALTRFRADERVAFLETPGPVWPSRARNLAIARARGALVASLDADCVPDPGWLAALLAAHERFPRSVVGGSLRIDAPSPWAFADNLASFHAYLPSRRPSLRPFLPACNLSAPRAVFDAVGPFDESLERSEDLDWTFRARRAGFALRFRPEVLAWHRSQRASARSVLAKAERTGHDSLAVRARHGDRFARRFASAWRLASAAPLLALGATFTACLRDASGRGVLAAPLVLAAKAAWCLGAARRLSAAERSRGAVEAAA